MGDEHEFFGWDYLGLNIRNITKKIALGTVQFGLPYGVANIDGQVSKEIANEIMSFAFKSGIRKLDTAINYGESEKCLGEIGVDEWKVTTKIPAFPENCPDITSWINEQIDGSLKRLRISKVDGLMLHSTNQLHDANGEELWKALQDLKNQGVAEKIGFSIYDPEELNSIWRDFPPDIIQAPYNILDKRLKTSFFLKKLHEQGIEVQVRSVFLQGLLLMENAQRPAKFDHWKTLWKSWDHWLAEKQLTPLEACLSFVVDEKMIDHVVVGVEKLSQLKEIIDSSAKQIGSIPQELKINDQNLINPSNWNKL